MKLKQHRKQALSRALTLGLSLCLCTMPLASVFASNITFYDNYAEVGTGLYTDKWAATFAEKALAQGLIPASFPRDLREDINREEFATLLVMVYENYTSQVAPSSNTPIFTDTDNVYVTKAYKLGFITGRSSTEFDPTGLITREEAAVMVAKLLQTVNLSAFSYQLTMAELLESDRVPNALKSYMIQFLYYFMYYAPDGESDLPWYGIEYAHLYLPAIYRLMIDNNKYIYNDHNSISTWADESVYLCYTFDVMKGDDDGNFNPSHTIDVQSSLVLALQILGF